MKFKGRLMLFCTLLVLGLAVEAQQFLLVENVRNLKNFKYYTGDDIRVRAKPDNRIVEGVITGISDSSIYIGDWDEVYFSEVITIYRTRISVNWLQGALLLGGAAYFSIDSFNRLINNQAPVVLAETAYISAGMVAAGFAVTPLRHKRMKAEKWTLRLIDFGQLGYTP
jgi:hypothetical protein